MTTIPVAPQHPHQSVRPLLVVRGQGAGGDGRAGQRAAVQAGQGSRHCRPVQRTAEATEATVTVGHLRPAWARPEAVTDGRQLQNGPPHRCGQGRRRSGTQGRLAVATASGEPPPSGRSVWKERPGTIRGMVVRRRPLLRGPTVPASGGDQPVELFLQPRRGFRRSRTRPGQAPPLEIHEVRAAPEAQVGVVGLARAVHAAAHHGDRDRQIGRVARSARGPGRPARRRPRSPPASSSGN